MKKIIDLIVVFIGLVLLHVLTDIHVLTLIILAIMIGVMLYFSKRGYNTISVLFGIVITVVLIYSFVSAKLPLTVNKTEVVWSNVDQKLSTSMGNRVKTYARDIWIKNRDEKSRIFLGKYNSLVASGKLKEAQDSLNCFLNTWYPESKKQGIRALKKVSVKVRTDSTDYTRPSYSRVARDSLLNPGRYVFHLNAGEETAWLHFPSCGTYHFDISSKTYKQKIIFSDGSVYQDGPKVIFPTKGNARFKIKANVDEDVVVVVNRIS